MFDTGESLSPNKFKFCFWENPNVYIESNRMRSIHAKLSLNYICYLVSPFVLPIAVLSWSCCLVSELAALVRAFAVDFNLVYPAPCWRDNWVPIHIFLLWDCLIVSLLLVPPSGRQCQCHLSYFLWLDSPSAVANSFLQTGCLKFCQHLAMGCLLLLWVELCY